MADLTFEPRIPLALWASLAAASIALLACYGLGAWHRLGKRKATGILALMAIVPALPLGMLLNPTWLERLPPPEGKPVLKVFIDSSASMATLDGAKKSSRFAEARDVAAALSDRLSDRYEIQVNSFAAAVTPTDLAALAKQQPSGQTTDLASALTEAVRGDVPSGQTVVLLSDGVHNAEGGEASVVAAASRAKAVAAPLLVKTLGGLTVVTDLAVDVRSSQELAFVSQQVLVQVELQPQGMSGRSVSVALMEGDNEVARREVTLSDKPTLVEFPIKQDKSGVYRYEARVDPLDGEVTSANNRAGYVLRVVDEPIRVLLLEGKPYWDTKFLVRTLASDPSIELASVVRLAEGRYLQRTLERMPLKNGVTETTARPEQWKVLSSTGDLLSDAEKLSKYQVVVLGRDAESYLTDEALVTLKRWLARDGGSLVCFRGTPTAQVNQRLATLLPLRSSTVRESRFRMRLTDVGKELRWISTSGDTDTLANMPSLATRTESSSTQPLAVVWAVGQSSQQETPVVVSMPYGTGHVVMLEGAGMWRWAFMAPQYEKHEAVYAALWQSLTRWLVSNTGLLPAQTWALRPDKIRFHSGESATASLLVRETALTGGVPTVEIAADGDAEFRKVAAALVGDEPGAYRIAFGKLPEGRYRIRVAGAPEDDASARGVFEVRNNADEVVKVAANRELMQRLAEVSGGAVLETASADEVAAKVDEHLNRMRPEQVRKTPAWDRWWVLAGMFRAWAVAWGVRRHRGLV